MKTYVAFLVAVVLGVGYAMTAAIVNEVESTPLTRLALQAPDVPQPPAGNGEDEDGGAEAGRPLQCDNFAQTAPAHRCHCARDQQKCHGFPDPPADVKMDSHCLTFCKQQHCQCAGHGCRS